MYIVKKFLTITSYFNTEWKGGCTFDELLDTSENLALDYIAMRQGENPSEYALLLDYTNMCSDSLGIVVSGNNADCIDKTLCSILDIIE